MGRNTPPVRAQARGGKTEPNRPIHRLSPPPVGPVNTFLISGDTACCLASSTSRAFCLLDLASQRLSGHLRYLYIDEVVFLMMNSHCSEIV